MIIFSKFKYLFFLNFIFLFSYSYLISIHILLYYALIIGIIFYFSLLKFNNNFNLLNIYIFILFILFFWSYYFGGIINWYYLLNYKFLFLEWI